MKGKVKGDNGKPMKRPLSPSLMRREDWKGKAVRLYLQGHSQETVRQLMTEETGGHKFAIGTINKYIHETIQEWQRSKEEIITTWKAEQLEKINLLETTYWDAWFNSCKVVKSTTKKQTKTSAGGMALAEKQDQERQSQGDVRFLQGIQWCIEQRCKILGPEVAALVQINNTNTNTAVAANVSNSNRTVIFNGRTIRTSQELLSTDEEN